MAAWRDGSVPPLFRAIEQCKMTRANFCIQIIYILVNDSECGGGGGPSGLCSTITISAWKRMNEWMNEWHNIVVPQFMRRKKKHTHTQLYANHCLCLICVFHRSPLVMSSVWMKIKPAVSASFSSESMLHWRQFSRGLCGDGGCSVWLIWFFFCEYGRRHHIRLINVVHRKFIKQYELFLLYYYRICRHGGNIECAHARGNGSGRSVYPQPQQVIKRNWTTNNNTQQKEQHLALATTAADTHALNTHTTHERRRISFIKRTSKRTRARGWTKYVPFWKCFIEL